MGFAHKKDRSGQHGAFFQSLQRLICEGKSDVSLRRELLSVETLRSQRRQRAKPPRLVPGLPRLSCRYFTSVSRSHPHSIGQATSFYPHRTPRTLPASSAGIIISWPDLAAASREGPKNETSHLYTSLHNFCG